MSISLRKVLPFLVLVGLCSGGCTSITIKSNKDATSVRKLDRVFVLVNQGEMGKQPLSNVLIDSFRSCLSNSPVQLAFSIASPLELDENSHLSQIEEFQPQAVLLIRVKTFLVDEFGGYPRIVYDASLFSPKMDKRMWRATIDNCGGTALMNKRMREMAEKIVLQLRQDGFL